MSLNSDLYTAGLDAIRSAVARSDRPSIVIEMTRQLGDILHSTVVVRQFRVNHPTHHIVMAIGSCHASTFSTFTPDALGPHSFAQLPDLPAYPQDGPYRVHWVRETNKLQNVRAFGCGVHPWGWPGGSITDAILLNAGLDRLTIERRPCLPLSLEDETFATSFIAKNGLGNGFIALEYHSVTIQPRPTQWFVELIRHIRLPVVSLAHPDAQHVTGTVDGRSTTFRQAKALIARSQCFIGAGSGLSVVAASLGCTQPIVELVTPNLSIPAIGYASGAPYANMHTDSQIVVANKVNEFSTSGYVSPPHASPDSKSTRKRGQTPRNRR